MAYLLVLETVMVVALVGVRRALCMRCNLQINIVIITQICMHRPVSLLTEINLVWANLSRHYYTNCE